MKDEKETAAPNFMKMIRWSNHVVQWIVTEILSVKDNLKLRALIMEKVVSIGKVHF